MLPSGLPILFRKAGLNVVVVDGWQARGRPGSFDPVGVLNHHTGASARGWSKAKELAYAKWMFVTGRPDLPAPLCQIALGRSGTVYVGAAGRANHAGTAKASGSVGAGDGNALYIGIEWMLSGTEKIPAKMVNAGVILNAVLTEKVTKTSVETISAHYQTSVTGKWDIGDPDGIPFKDKRVLDVAKFRERVKAERAGKPGPKYLTAALVNVPIKVGPNAWAKCWRRARKRGAIFGLNESLNRKQRDTYAALIKKSDGRIRQFGLRQTPNPVFWRTKRFAFVSGEVHEIHRAATGPLAKEFPGFNAARYVTEVVLRQRANGQEFAVLNTHWVPNGPKVAQPWGEACRRASKRKARELVREHRKAGRIVIFMGDTNIRLPFWMPKGFKWARGVGIDKMGANRPGTASLFKAPTDHKFGVRAKFTIR